VIALRRLNEGAEQPVAGMILHCEGLRVPLNANGKAPARNLDGFDHAVACLGGRDSVTGNLDDRLLMTAVHVEPRQSAAAE